METQSRSVVLWASAHPILSRTRVSLERIFKSKTFVPNFLLTLLSYLLKSDQTVTAMQSVLTPRHNLVLTAGIDARIRMWDLNCEADSFVVAGAGFERINPANFKYT